jgi:hypothetical protein
LADIIALLRYKQLTQLEHQDKDILLLKIFMFGLVLLGQMLAPFKDQQVPLVQ